MIAYVATALFALAQLTADPPHACDACAEWNQPQEPFRLYGNTWFVGTQGLGSVLITSEKGHILIDGGLPQSAPLIAQNIGRAGFRLEDVKVILNSHTHYDHAGGIAALQRASGARVMASASGKRALENGGPLTDDPQFAFGKEHNDYPKVAPVGTVKDGEELRVGDLRITARFTPGHTTGGTTWTWKSCEGERCVTLVYGDSLNAVSAPGFRFTGKAAATLEQSIRVVEGMPCDILIAAHPYLVGMASKLAAWRTDTAVNPFIDSGACRKYAGEARQRLQARLLEEATQQPPAPTP